MPAKPHQGTVNITATRVAGHDAGSPEKTEKLVAFNKTDGARNRTMYRTDKLRPWMKTYASWIALHDTLQLPGIEERTKKVKFMCHGKLTKKGLKYLEERQDFKNLVEELKQDDRKRARLHMEIYAVDMVDMHRKATEQLMHEGKYDKIAPLTTPYLDRVWPKADENQQQAQVIQINLEGSYAKHQLATLDDEDTPVVEAEEIAEVEEGDDL